MAILRLARRRVYQAPHRTGWHGQGPRPQGASILAAHVDAVLVRLGVRAGFTDKLIGRPVAVKCVCERSLHLSHPLTPTLVRATRQAAGSGSAQLRAAGRAGRMVALLVAVLLAAGGCAAPKRTFEPDQDHNTLDEMAFIHYLATLPNVTVDEGYHAVLLLDPEAGAATRFAEREAALVNRGAVRRSWRLEPDDLLDAGTLAHMLAKVCEAEGGVNDLLWGSWGLGDRRYALRTARWHELMPYNVPYRTVSGGEVLAAVTRAAEFIERSEGEPG